MCDKDNTENWQKAALSDKNTGIKGARNNL